MLDQDQVLKYSYKALESNLTDQDIAKQCTSLTAEDIHAIRKTKADISILPYVALLELNKIGKEKAVSEVLNSPLKEKEFAIFKERLSQHFRLFKEQQKSKHESEQSQMDDLIVAEIFDDVKDKFLNNQNELLDYFDYYQEKL